MSVQLLHLMHSTHCSCNTPLHILYSKITNNNALQFRVKCQSLQAACSYSHHPPVSKRCHTPNNASFKQVNYKKSPPPVQLL